MKLNPPFPGLSLTAQRQTMGKSALKERPARQAWRAGQAGGLRKPVNVSTRHVHPSQRAVVEFFHRNPAYEAVHALLKPGQRACVEQAGNVR